jgi:hypothetical protein
VKKSSKTYKQMSDEDEIEKSAKENSGTPLKQLTVCLYFC